MLDRPRGFQQERTVFFRLGKFTAEIRFVHNFPVGDTGIVEKNRFQVISPTVHVFKKRQFALRQSPSQNRQNGNAVFLRLCDNGIPTLKIPFPFFCFELIPVQIGSDVTDTRLLHQFEFLGQLFIFPAIQMGAYAIWISDGCIFFRSVQSDSPKQYAKHTE